MKALPSSHQERLWFIDQFETGNVYAAEPTYHNIPLLLQGRGQLDGGKLAAAWRSLIARHGALRTRIGTEAGQTIQMVGWSDDRMIGSAEARAPEAAPRPSDHPTIRSSDYLAADAPWTEHQLGNVTAAEALEAALADAARDQARGSGLTAIPAEQRRAAWRMLRNNFPPESHARLAALAEA